MVVEICFGFDSGIGGHVLMGQVGGVGADPPSWLVARFLGSSNCCVGRAAHGSCSLSVDQESRRTSREV